MAEFTMPSLGADMEAGTLAAWCKKAGDSLKRGDIIAEVETDKGIIEVEVFSDGVIERLLVEPGTKVPVGTPLALIREPGESVAAAPAVPVTAAKPAPETAPAPRPEIPPPPPAGGAPRQKVSPAARRLAEELGIDQSHITGTGPDGAVTREDVERAATRGAAPAPAEPQDAKTRMRQAIAAAMARSKREIPHYYVGTTVDLSAALGWLEAYNASVSVPDRLLPGALFIKAVALALRDFPELNGRWEQGSFVASEGIHVGVAISLRGGGLVAPAIADTDRMPLGELMRRFRDLVSRARAGALRSSEFSGGTITVTSLGDRGAETVYGVIYPPQVALVGFGKVVERPWVAGGQVAPRRTVHVTLSADHRASDGHRGALFVDAVDQILQQPAQLA